MAKPSKIDQKISLNLIDLFTRCLTDLSPFIDEATHGELSRLVLSGRVDWAGVQGLLEDRVSSAMLHEEAFLRVAALRQLLALLEKNADLPGTSDLMRKETALAKFARSERICRITNKRLRYFRTHPSRNSTLLSETLGLAVDISHEIFGGLDLLKLLRVAKRSGFGPGFTFSSFEAAHRNLYYKVGGPHSVTREALPYVKFLLPRVFPHWAKALVENLGEYDVVEGNRVTTVPKNSVTDRTIAIEPSLNVFLQKGVDAYLKSRLRHVGVDLKDQERNKPPARLSSMGAANAATLDLSQASDSVSIELVRSFVPSLWFTLLDDLRSQSYTMDKGKTWNRYEKFSSMGNAFTFPLETIVFYAVAKACTIQSGGDLSVLRVYGDDIVVDQRAALLCAEVLRFLGFRTNVDKSFVHGPFRETCGSDFYKGVDLRPVYVRRIPSSDVEVFNLYNRFLWGRVGFRLQQTCAYLFGSVRKPLIGPPYLPAGEQYHRWYAGRSVQFDHYFHAPSSAGQRFRRWDPDLQTQVWRIQLVRYVPTREDTSNWKLQFLYLAFLLGFPGEKIPSNSRFRRVVPYEIISFWPEPPWRPYLFDYTEDGGGSV